MRLDCPHVIKSRWFYENKSHLEKKISISRKDNSFNECFVSKSKVGLLCTLIKFYSIVVSSRQIMFQPIDVNMIIHRGINSRVWSGKAHLFFLPTLDCSPAPSHTHFLNILSRIYNFLSVGLVYLFVFFTYPSPPPLWQPSACSPYCSISVLFTLRFVLLDSTYN